MSPARRHVPALLVVAALATAAPLGVSAQSRQAPPEPEARSDHRALSDAVRRVERATNGQVLSAERVPFDGRDVNRVKVIDDRGRVRVYWDDPQAHRAERAEQQSRERAERRRDPRQDARQDARRERAEPPRRTRRHDGAAFNL